MFTRILLSALLAQALSAQDPLTADLTIHTDQPGPKVNRQLFGQFAEHLGAGIYGGIWVGEDRIHAAIGTTSSRPSAI